MTVHPDIKQEIIKFGRFCYERNLLVALDGNLSIRLTPDEVVCTRSGCHKGFLSVEDIIAVDRKGCIKEGRGQPTSEIFMHLACYEERPDIRAIIHAHPPLSVACTIAGVSLAKNVLPEVVLTLGKISTVEYITTGTELLASAIRPFARNSDAFLLERHGVVTLGQNLFQAFCKLETVEHLAHIVKAALELGQLRELPGDEVLKLRDMGRKRYGAIPGEKPVQRNGNDQGDLLSYDELLEIISGETLRILKKQGL